MSDINVTTITGRLTRDPLVNNGRTSMGFFAVASHYHYRDTAGVLQEEVAFVPCKVFGAWCDTLRECHQADTVVASGRLRTETREKDGTKRTQLTLICNSLHPVRQVRASAGSQEPEPATACASSAGELPDAQEKLPF